MSLLQEIVEKGDGIYKAKYKRDCEQRYLGSTLPLMLKPATASSLRALQQQSGTAKVQANRARCFA